MTLGGANVWSDFSYGFSLESPCGWLLKPDRRLLILFAKNKKSPRNNTKIFVVTYYANNLGLPTTVKASTLMYLDNAWDKWHNLQLEGWTLEALEFQVSE